jgi:hypothetical protein
MKKKRDKIFMIKTTLEVQNMGSPQGHRLKSYGNSRKGAINEVDEFTPKKASGLYTFERLTPLLTLAGEENCYVTVT